MLNETSRSAEDERLPTGTRAPRGRRAGQPRPRRTRKARRAVARQRLDAHQAEAPRPRERRRRALPPPSAPIAYETDASATGRARARRARSRRAVGAPRSPRCGARAARVGARARAERPRHAAVREHDDGQQPERAAKRAPLVVGEVDRRPEPAAAEPPPAAHVGPANLDRRGHAVGHHAHEKERDQGVVRAELEREPLRRNRGRRIGRRHDKSDTSPEGLIIVTGLRVVSNMAWSQQRRCQMSCCFRQRDLGRCDERAATLDEHHPAARHHQRPDRIRASPVRRASRARASATRSLSGVALTRDRPACGSRRGRQTGEAAARSSGHRG